jgi:hypothetical protein
MPTWIRDEDLPDWQAPQPLAQSAAPGPETAANDPEEAAETGPNDTDLDAWLAVTRPIEQLRKLCLQRGLSAAGGRADLVARLRDAAVAP